MNRKALVLGGLLVLQPALAQAEVFVLIDGIPGNVATAAYQGWHLAKRFDWSYDKSSTAQPFKLQVTMNQRSASFATIKQAAFNGASVKRIVFDHRSISAASASVVLARLTCENAVISALSFTSAGETSENDVFPTVALQLGCVKLLWEDFEYSPSGTFLRSVKGESLIPTKAP